MITEDLDRNRDRAPTARALRYNSRVERTSILNSAEENNIININNNIIENNIIEMNNQLNNQDGGDPLPQPVTNEQLHGLFQQMQQQMQQMQQMADLLANSTQQIQQLQEQIEELKNPMVPVIAPVIQQLLGEEPDFILYNMVGDVIMVEERMFIRPPAANALSDEAKAQLKPPNLKSEDLVEMTPKKWIDYIAKFSHYYTIGGEKPASTFWEALVMQTMTETLRMTVTDFVSLTPQKQVYSMLKVFWRRPEEDSHQLIQGIRGIECLPGAKGNMHVVVSYFVSRMRTVLPASTFTKTLLDGVRNQVFIREWVDEYKTKTYFSYEDFYNHLKELAISYDSSIQRVKELTSTKPTKEKEKEKKEKNEKNEKNPDRPQDRTRKCLLCKGDHYAFKLDNDYGKEYNDQILWECPNIKGYGPDLRKIAWDSRKAQIARKKKQKAEKEKGGGAGGTRGAAGSSA